VFEFGETETEPEVAPPVENPVPVQDVAPAEDQESVVEEPSDIVEGEAESDAVGAAKATSAPVPKVTTNATASTTPRSTDFCVMKVFIVFYYCTG
jgi:hypothetical protein